MSRAHEHCERGTRSAPIFASSASLGAIAAEAFAAERWSDIEAALDELRGDRVVVVTDDGSFVRERRPLLRWLSREFPDVPFKQLRRPAPAGAVLLVVLRSNEIGVALVRPVSPWVGAA